MKKKIAIVNQRYGAEVNGGSEYYTKKLAEHLLPYYDIEVLTTTALDYDTWAPYYPEGEQVVDGVFVRRFPVEKQRSRMGFRIINKLLQTLPYFWRVLEPIWIKSQGPFCPELIQYIRSHKEEFDVFIFVTYLYYTTAVGVPEVIEKAILVPTAHDEYCIYFHMYQKLFQKVRGIVYLTEEECNFVQGLFDNKNIPYQIAGSGIEVPEHVDIAGFRKKYQIESEYVLYVGRVDVGKNCDELFDYFITFSRTKKSQVELVVIGKIMMEKPECDKIHFLGFLSEEYKYAAIAGAKALIMPSAYESLSLVVLEAMALGVPVMVNGVCNVLEGHCRKSGAGISYRDYYQFEAGLSRILIDDKLYENMHIAGKQYVCVYYDWQRTIKKYQQIIDRSL